jgi:hypothetical protein
MHHVEMKVQYVEVSGPAFDVAQHREVRGELGFQQRPVEANRLIADCNERGPSPCIRSSE